jgi:hypothetical protein
MQFLAVVSFLVCALVVDANPAIEREFRRVVNSNQCLKGCMEPVQASNLELSIFKRSNYSDYLLQLDTICDLITSARHCIDRCGIQSNPFALISMNAICSEKSRQDAKLLEPCLTQVGAQINEQCAEICGDYEQLNNQLHSTPLNQDDKTEVAKFNSQLNGVCSVLKCSARCSTDQFNKQCGRLSNGLMAGDLIRDTVERVLSTHRMDLQVFGLMDAVKKSSQPECNYLFTPEVLFNAQKDMVSQQALRAPERVEVEQPALQTQPEADTDDFSRAQKQLQVRVLKKQLEVLNKQLEILDKQEHKMDAGNEMPRFMQAPPTHSEFANDMF